MIYKQVGRITITLLSSQILLSRFPLHTCYRQYTTLGSPPVNTQSQVPSSQVSNPPPSTHNEENNLQPPPSSPLPYKLPYLDNEGFISGIQSYLRIPDQSRSLIITGPHSTGKSDGITEVLKKLIAANELDPKIVLHLDLKGLAGAPLERIITYFHVQVEQLVEILIPSADLAALLAKHGLQLSESGTKSRPYPWAKYTAKITGPLEQVVTQALNKLPGGSPRVLGAIFADIIPMRYSIKVFLEELMSGEKKAGEKTIPFILGLLDLIGKQCHAKKLPLPVLRIGDAQTLAHASGGGYEYYQQLLNCLQSAKQQINIVHFKCLIESSDYVDAHAVLDSLESFMKVEVPCWPLTMATELLTTGNPPFFSATEWRKLAPVVGGHQGSIQFVYGLLRTGVSIEDAIKSLIYQTVGSVQQSLRQISAAEKIVLQPWWKRPFLPSLQLSKACHYLICQLCYHDWELTLTASAWQDNLAAKTLIKANIAYYDGIKKKLILQREVLKIPLCDHVVARPLSQTEARCARLSYKYFSNVSSVTPPLTEGEPPLAV